MDDRELLEMAAKATGLYVNPPDYIAIKNDLPVVFALDGKTWNPLTDDGDALRLAVKLNLEITFDILRDGAIVGVNIPLDNNMFDSDYQWIEWLGKDAAAATRRAIVRAAAEIGKGMK